MTSAFLEESSHCVLPPPPRPHHTHVLCGSFLLSHAVRASSFLFDPREGEAPSPARDGSPEVRHDVGARLRRLLAASLGSLEDPSSQWWVGSHLRRRALASAAARECLRQAVRRVASGHSAWAPSSLPDRGHLSALTECCAALRSPRTLVVRGPSPQGPCRSPCAEPTIHWAPRVRSNNQHHPEQSGTRACSPQSQGLSFWVTEPLRDPPLCRVSRKPRARRAGDMAAGSAAAGTRLWFHSQ